MALVGDLDKAEREHAEARKQADKAQRQFNRQNAKGLVEKVRASKLNYNEETPSKWSANKDAIIPFSDNTLKKIGVKVYNTGLEIVAKGLEAGKSIVDAIQDGIHYINDYHKDFPHRQFTHQEEQDFRDNFKATTSDELRKSKRIEIPLKQDLRDFMDNLVDKIRKNEFSLKDAEEIIEDSDIPKNSKTRLHQYLKQKYHEEIFKGSGEEIGKELLMQHNNDYDTALHELDVHFQQLEANAKSDAEKENLRSKQAATQAYLLSKKIQGDVASGKIKVDYAKQKEEADLRNKARAIGDAILKKSNDPSVAISGIDDHFDKNKELKGDTKLRDAVRAYLLSKKTQADIESNKIKIDSAQRRQHADIQEKAKSTGEYVLKKYISKTKKNAKIMYISNRVIIITCITTILFHILLNSCKEYHVHGSFSGVYTKEQYELLVKPANSAGYSQVIIMNTEIYYNIGKYIYNDFHLNVQFIYIMYLMYTLILVIIALRILKHIGVKI